MDDLPGSTYPRLVIAGIAGDSGKTLVALGLTLLAREGGVDVRAYKKGPDFIDAAWLSWASGRPARNLDSFLMGFPASLESFLRHGSPNALHIIEGNRGLYDGLDSEGTHSTAELSKTLRSPVVLVLNAAKMTRTAAALVLGCMTLDRGVRLGGVVLNNVAGARHLGVLRDSIEKTCEIPVLGTLPRIRGDSPLPDRHLGLLPPQEHSGLFGLGARIAELCRPHLDVEGLLALARTGPPLESPSVDMVSAVPVVTVGYLSDGAFTFYYPDNLEALARSGARLLPISPLSGLPFPSELDALYIGGGFPETHAGALSANGPWMEELRLAVEGGLPVYAECGGLMFLSRAILWQGSRFPMACILPFEVEVLETPQGHGYSELVVDADNPFFPPGTRLRGHEFHYSRIAGLVPPLATACRVERGTGCLPGREAVVRGSVWAGYTHLHALASPEWAPGVVASALKFREGKGGR